MTRTYLIAFVLCGCANFVFSLMILRELAAAGIKVGFMEIRWHIHKHLKTYRKITRERSGKVGIACYGYLGTLGGVIVFGLLIFTSLSTPS